MGLCTCTPTVISPPAPACGGNCIYTPNMLVTDQVTACDPVTDIDISPVIAACGSTPAVYSIISSKNVSNPTITSTAVTFTPVNNNYAPGEIVYKVACGRLSDFGKIIIVYTNNCVNVNCDEYETCDKCTGDCIPIPPEVSINNVPSISIS